MKILLFALILLLTPTLGAQAQTPKACDVTTVEAVTALLKTALIFDANSPVNKNGKYECRYTSPTSASTYTAIGVLDAKVQYGYDLLKTDFDAYQKAVAKGQLAVSKYNHFYPFPSGGPYAYYMTGEKDEFSPEAFVFKWRKGDAIMSFSAGGIPLETLKGNVEAIYKLLNK